MHYFRGFKFCEDVSKQNLPRRSRSRAGPRMSEKYCVCHMQRKITFPHFYESVMSALQSLFQQPLPPRGGA
jgi:hypothetical protein